MLINKLPPSVLHASSVQFLMFDHNCFDMTRQAIIEKAVKAINQLPEDKAEEIPDFADFVSKRYEEHLLAQCVQNLASKTSLPTPGLLIF